MELGDPAGLERVWPQKIVERGGGGCGERGRARGAHLLQAQVGHPPEVRGHPRRPGGLVVPHRRAHFPPPPSPPERRRRPFVPLWPPLHFNPSGPPPPSHGPRGPPIPNAVSHSRSGLHENIFPRFARWRFPGSDRPLTDTEGFHRGTPRPGFFPRLFLLPGDLQQLPVKLPRRGTPGDLAAKHESPRVPGSQFLGAVLMNSYESLRGGSLRSGSGVGTPWRAGWAVEVTSHLCKLLPRVPAGGHQIALRQISAKPAHYAPRQFQRQKICLTSCFHTRGELKRGVRRKLDSGVQFFLDAQPFQPAHSSGATHMDKQDGR